MLRPGGRLAYLSIVLAPGLSRSQRSEGTRLGPRAVAATAPDSSLVRSAGFEDVDVTDVTTEFLAAARSWQREYDRHADEVMQIIGEKEWEERQSNRAGLRRGIEEGLLQRVLVTGRRPQGRAGGPGDRPQGPPDTEGSGGPFTN